MPGQLLCHPFATYFPEWWNRAGAIAPFQHSGKQMANGWHTTSKKVPQKGAFLEVPFFSGSSKGFFMEVFWKLARVAKICEGRTREIPHQQFNLNLIANACIQGGQH
jgi:hypothetical protein